MGCEVLADGRTDASRATLAARADDWLTPLRTDFASPFDASVRTDGRTRMLPGGELFLPPRGDGTLDNGIVSRR